MFSLFLINVMSSSLFEQMGFLRRLKSSGSLKSRKKSDRLSFE